MLAKIRSVCPYDCPDACGLLVTVENGRAINICGDPDHPVTRGLLCPKMAHYEKTIYSSRRLSAPLRRVGKKGTGQFEPISWDNAIDIICSSWRKVIAIHGAEAILPYSYAGTMGLIQRNAGHAFFYKLGASRLERTICSPAKDAGWKALMGDTPALNPTEAEQSDLVILWGINAVATSIHSVLDAQAARRNGARILAIDTYRTPTCDLADEAFLIRPGSDGALALSMLHIFDRDGTLDLNFISSNVIGYEEFKCKILPDCSPGEMSVVCGLSVDVIERLAYEYAKAKAPFIRLGSGLSRYGNSAMTVRTISCLPAAVGAWSKQGGGIFLGTSTGGAFQLNMVTREDFITDSSRLISMNQLGDALTEMSAPPVMSLYVYHSNPAAIAPDQNTVIKGLEREDLFTVVHERFLTDTAKYADIVLPATSSLEHSDLYRSYGSYHAQRCRAAIKPLGGAKSNLEVFSLLAAGMGWDEPFFSQSADDLIELLLNVKNLWRSNSVTEHLLTGEPVMLTPPTDPKREWLTPSGKIQILNEREPEPLPRLLPTHAEQDGYPLRLQSGATPFALNSSFYEQDQLRSRQARMELLMNYEDAEVRQLSEGESVIAYNKRGEVRFTLRITGQTPVGTVVTEGVWWQEFLPGDRGVNALTSQRLTDAGRGSTLYDVTVDVRRS